MSGAFDSGAAQAGSVRGSGVQYGSPARAPRSPKWIVLKGRHHRATTFRYRLRKAGRVRVTVTQLAPRCGVTRSFQLRGHKGVNRFRFSGRLGGRRLAPGTYRIVARAVSSGRRLFVTRVVIVASGRPNRSQLAALWMRNSCLPPVSLAGETGTALTGAMPLFPVAVRSGVDLDGRAQASKGGVLGSETGKSSPSHELPAGLSGPVSTDHGFQPNSTRDWLRLFLFAVLGISLVLAIRYTVRDLSR